jgi:hypothetical protein
MRRLLIRLYPAIWRVRYGDEFEALLEERPLGPFDVADIILGAIDARLRLRGRRSVLTQTRGFSMSLRIGGIAAIVTGATWGFALVASTGLLPWIVADDDQWVQFAVFTVGGLALLVALIGLSAFQAREHPALIWAAFAVPAVGTVVALTGLIGMFLLNDAPLVAGISSWYLFSFGLIAAFLGSGLFAIASYRTGALSRRGSTLLAVGSLFLLPTLVVSADDQWAPSFIMVGITVVGFSLGWIVLGASAIRFVKPAVDTQPA